MTSSRRIETAAAAALFVALTLLFTWPVAAGIGRTVPSDFGDPLLNTWILAWDATHFGPGWWSANIFYPQPLALGYSEHLAAQAVSIAPVYWLTRNPILCYNLVFLATFVISGLGVFLLARELGVGAPAAFVAGMAYAFAPYRIGSLPHIQVISSEWMPFVLLGFRRYFESRRARALAWAGAAWLLQNLSCGYYLLFFTPILAIYVAWELSTRRLWTNTRTLGAIAIVCLCVGAATIPFLLPYLELRQHGFLPRSLAETRKYSADVYAYLTADPNLHLWGSLVRAWPKAEGALFPGATIAALAIAGAFAGHVRGASDATPHAERARARFVDWLAPGAMFVAAAVIVGLLLGWTIRMPLIKVTSLSRTLIAIAIGALLWLAVSPRSRARFASWSRSLPAIFTILTLFACAMSFGPEIRAMDRLVLARNLYSIFYSLVPGYDGLRVPARFGMIVMLGLAVLAAFGLQTLSSRLPRVRAREAALGIWWPSVVCGALIAVESFAAPIPVDGNSTAYSRPGLAALPTLAREPPAVYDFVATLPADSVLVELPLGEPAFDVRYMYYSTRHWRRLVNGYSGGAPPDYEQLDLALQEVGSRPERAWEALRAARPTHAIVHEAHYAGAIGSQTSEWLRSRGGVEIAVFASDRVFRMPR